MAILSRLSPANITDGLLRVELYREIRNAQARLLPGWQKYAVQPADITMPEKIAYKVYGIDNLKWVIQVAAALDDSRELLEAGTDLHLPTTAWLRERIKYYMAMEKQGAAGASS